MSSSSYSPSEQWLLSGGPCPPTTHEFGLFEAPQDVVVEAFMRWLSGLGQMPEKRSIRGGLEEGLAALLPLTTLDRRRFVFFQFDANWTAFFDNGVGGTDAASGSHLAMLARCRGVRVVVAPDGPDCFGATIFELYGPEPTPFLNYIRTVGVVNDGGKWRFDTSGTPLPFEDEAAYARRRIKDRFTPAMLNSYLAKMGVQPFNPDSYRSPILIARKDPEPPGIEYFTFQEAMTRFAPR